MPTDNSLVDYYAKRANEYERIYQKPERQGDLATIKRLCAQTLAGQTVLEIACGTGYWTQPVSQSARSILATDINDEVLQIARMKSYGCPVTFEKADAFDLGFLAGNHFTAGMAIHWWSHLRKADIGKFLDGYHGLFRPGAVLVIMDNRFVAGSSTPICRTDGEGNTYQLRRLQDGTVHEVLKNFPGESEVAEILSGAASEMRWTVLPYYWFLTYRLK